MKKAIFVSDRYPMLKLKECVVVAETKGDGRIVLFTEQKIEFIPHGRGLKNGGPQFIPGKVKVHPETLPQFVVHASEIREV